MGRDDLEVIREIEPGEIRKIEFTPENASVLVIKDPRVWWTHDLGKQELYELTLIFAQKRGTMAEETAGAMVMPKPGGPGMPGLPRGSYSDLRVIRFGIREVSDYLTEQGHRGFKLHGKKILIRGGGWADDLFLDVRPKKLNAEVLNALRLEGFWGTSEALYDFCDRNGILLMVGWSCHWEWENYFGKPADKRYGGITSPEDIALVAESWKDQVLWLRNHPAIFVWAEASDLIPHPDLERRYIEIMKDIDPTRPMLVSTKGNTSDVSGPSRVKMLGPYDDVPPVYWYVDTRNGGAYGFNTETGPGPQVPPVESLKKMLPEDKLWPINEVWNFHCNRGLFKTLGRYNEAMDRRLGPAKNLDDYVAKAHFLSYEAVRAMFEAFVANKPKATGVIQWMVNAAWPTKSRRSTSSVRPAA
jgi:exo-1,4-beta-D-glucosaminidase